MGEEEGCTVQIGCEWKCVTEGWLLFLSGKERRERVVCRGDVSIFLVQRVSLSVGMRTSSASDDGNHCH
jgi:hypothetical protein